METHEMEISRRQNQFLRPVPPYKRTKITEQEKAEKNTGKKTLE